VKKPKQRENESLKGVDTKDATSSGTIKEATAKGCKKPQREWFDPPGAKKNEESWLWAN